MVYSNFSPAAKQVLRVETKGDNKSSFCKVHSATRKEEKTKGQGPATESGIIKAATEKSKQLEHNGKYDWLYSCTDKEM